jgi:hypothetical protein
MQMPLMHVLGHHIQFFRWVILDRLAFQFHDLCTWLSLQVVQEVADQLTAGFQVSNASHILEMQVNLVYHYELIPQVLGHHLALKLVQVS